METKTVDKEKKATWKSWVCGIVLGLGLIIVGSLGVIEDDTVNNSLIQAGATQTAIGAIELKPELTTAFAKAADIIDAAVEARTTTPETLATLVSEELKAYTTTDVKPVVESAILYINQAYKTSDTEEQYHTKLKHLAAGFRAAVK